MPNIFVNQLLASGKVAPPPLIGNKSPKKSTYFLTTFLKGTAGSKKNNTRFVPSNQIFLDLGKPQKKSSPQFLD